LEQCGAKCVSFGEIIDLIVSDTRQKRGDVQHVAGVVIAFKCVGLTRKRRLIRDNSVESLLITIQSRYVVHA
jgi:hypothetical protein